MQNMAVLHLKIREPDFLPPLKHFGHSVYGLKSYLYTWYFCNSWLTVKPAQLTIILIMSSRRVPLV